MASLSCKRFRQIFSLQEVWFKLAPFWVARPESAKGVVFGLTTPVEDSRRATK